MITADQILCHLIGDYLLQSDWMATGKVRHFWIASCHALVYSLPFLVFHPSVVAWFVIYASHAFIDRFRLARYVVWVKNWLGPNKLWSECSATGYPAEKPVWLAVWLLIIADNILHISINGIALRFL